MALKAENWNSCSLHLCLAQVEAKLCSYRQGPFSIKSWHRSFATNICKNSSSPKPQTSLANRSGKNKNTNLDIQEPNIQFQTRNISDSQLGHLGWTRDAFKWQTAIEKELKIAIVKGAGFFFSQCTSKCKTSIWTADLAASVQDNGCSCSSLSYDWATKICKCQSVLRPSNNLCSRTRTKKTTRFIDVHRFKRFSTTNIFPERWWLAIIRYPTAWAKVSRSSGCSSCDPDSAIATCEVMLLEDWNAKNISTSMSLTCHTYGYPYGYPYGLVSSTSSKVSPPQHLFALERSGVVLQRPDIFYRLRLSLWRIFIIKLGKLMNTWMGSTPFHVGFMQPWNVAKRQM